MSSPDTQGIICFMRDLNDTHKSLLVKRWEKKKRGRERECSFHTSDPPNAEAENDEEPIP